MVLSSQHSAGRDGIDLPELTGWPAYTACEHHIQLETSSLKTRREMGDKDMMLASTDAVLIPYRSKPKEKLLVVVPVGNSGLSYLLLLLRVLRSHCSVDGFLNSLNP